MEDAIATLPAGPEDEDHAGTRLHGDDLDARGRRSARAASRSSRRTASTPATARRAGRARASRTTRPTRRRRRPSTRRPTRTTTPTSRSPATARPASASTSGRWTRTRPAAAVRWSSSSRRCSRARGKAEAKKATDRTEEEAIYVEAWGQCTTAGLKIVDGKLQINGKDATGLEVEDALAAPDGHRRAAQFQVIMIAEDLEELWATLGRARHVGQPPDRQQVHGGERRARTRRSRPTSTRSSSPRRPRWPRSARSAPTSA